MSVDKALMGMRLRELRERPPYWSREELARRLREVAGPQTRVRMPHVDSLAHMIKEWERGRYTPGRRFPNYRLLYARAFDMDEETLFGPQYPATLLRGGDEEERLLAVARRPSHLDTTVIDSLAANLAVQRRLEDTAGVAAVVGGVTAQLALVEYLLTEARGPLRPALANVAAQWAQFAGWLNAASKQHGHARAFFNRAADWAAEARNFALQAAVLTFKGHMAWEAGNLGEMIGLSAAARRLPGAHASEVTFGAFQEARGQAMLANAAAAERLIEEAEAHADAANVEIPPWNYYCGPAFYVLQRGLIYRYLGAAKPRYTERSITVLTGGLGQLGPAERASEWAAMFVLRLAAAHAQAGDVQAACERAGQAWAVARTTRSLRIQTPLRGLHRTLAERWQAHPDVAALGEALRA